jgi:hypothetical protein
MNTLQGSRTTAIQQWFHSMLTACVLVFGLTAPTQAQDAPQQLPAITLTAGMHRISAEVARTPEQRAIGLMHRKSMPTHAGMIFVFEQAEPLCFWMKNTLIPLSIAFLQEDGTILNIEEMKPLALDSHCSLRPVRFALEMNSGWFAKRGLKPGDRIGGELFRGPTPPAGGTK